ncbi:gamma-glutamyl hydrolase-like [Protopterus annectens]|uniref:gamma-glutamyl hydrolase-like n=1 Tax=Protopterus annectens TaxID=7888 RepID=UPI001CFAC459|nr:gamma-glutamyl hydrolase-like [Protopterus annectens]
MFRTRTILICVLLQYSCCLSVPYQEKKEINDRPIIGILAQETTDKDLIRFGNTYIASSYVKFLESAGCRVMPVRLNLSLSEYEEIFMSINGILFPGGAVNLQTSEFAKTAKIFYDLAIKSYDSGDYFPIWGTCLGFQLLTVLTAGQNLLSKTNSENISLPLNLTEAIQSSKMFQDFPPEILKALSKEDLTGNFHHYGLLTQTFRNCGKLKDFFTILSTNKDRNGVDFVSTIEGTKYPIYGVQWHPEVNRFQWEKDLAFPHSVNAVQLSYLMSNFFVNEARKSFHHYPSTEKENAALIYNYNPVYVGNFSSYLQVYFF